MQELQPFDEHETLSTGTWLFMVAFILVLFCAVIILSLLL